MRVESLHRTGEAEQRAISKGSFALLIRLVGRKAGEFAGGDIILRGLIECRHVFRTWCGRKVKRQDMLVVILTNQNN